MLQIGWKSANVIVGNELNEIVCTLLFTEQPFDNITLL